MHPILVVIASLELMSMESMINGIQNMFILRQVSNAYLLDIFILDPTQPDLPKTENFVTRPVDGPDSCCTTLQSREQSQRNCATLRIFNSVFTDKNVTAIYPNVALQMYKLSLLYTLY